MDSHGRRLTGKFEPALLYWMHGVLYSIDGHKLLRSSRAMARVERRWKYSRCSGRFSQLNSCFFIDE